MQPTHRHRKKRLSPLAARGVSLWGMDRAGRCRLALSFGGRTAVLVAGLTVSTAVWAAPDAGPNVPIQRPDAASGPDTAGPAPAEPAPSPDVASPEGAPAAPEGEPPAGEVPPSAEAGAPPSDVPAPPEGGPAAAEAPTESENPDPGSAPETDAPLAATEPAPAAPPEIAPSLLDGDTADAPATTPAPGPTRTQVQDDGAYDAAVAAAYKSLYRPDDNPGRLNITARLLFANAGGNEKVGGRLGGLQADIGQSWNRFGYAATASLWAGRIVLNDRVAEMNTLIGIGPTINYGRLALIGKGFLDFRLGYDIYYGVVNQQRDQPAVVAPQGDPNVTLEQAENLLPHGPRAQLNLGLLGGNNYRKRFHGFGVSMGYQGLVGSLRGELPFTHMLTIGLSYWLG